MWSAREFRRRNGCPFAWGRSLCKTLTAESDWGNVNPAVVTSIVHGMMWRGQDFEQLEAFWCLVKVGGLEWFAHARGLREVAGGASRAGVRPAPGAHQPDF